MTQLVRRAYRYRFYPTDEQAETLCRTFGCVRLVYNKALQERSAAWTLEHRRINYADTSAMLTEWKRAEEFAFLNEVSSVPLQQTLRHLQGAFAAFWDKRTGYPRFKSRKKSRASAEYTSSAFRYRDGQLFLAKMAEPIAISWSRPLPEGAEPTTVTISRDAAGRWFVSMLCEAAIDPLPAVESTVGVDAGLTSLVTLSTGEKVVNPRPERRDRERLARARQELARKHANSNNAAKARLKVARIHARIVDRRQDHLHKLTTRLVRDNQAIVIEDLTVRNMVRNHRLARAISDAAWFEMRRQLEYKCAWYGRTLVTIDPFYPSARQCGTCGAISGKLPLSTRVWTCQCGATHDRDVNAARNILAAGLAVMACGAGVRPQRSFPQGQSALKQEIRPVTVGLPARKGKEDVNYAPPGGKRPSPAG